MARRKLQAVVFDWAGTIVDHGSFAPVVAFQKAFRSVGVSLTDNEIRADMGKDKKKHIQEIIQTHNLQNCSVESIYKKFEEELRHSIQDRCHWIKGADDTIRRLKQVDQVSVGTCSGYTLSMMAPLMQLPRAAGLEIDVVASDLVSKGRPYPYMLWRSCERLGVSCITPETVVKVGDTIVDIQEGRNAGAFTVGVTLTGNEAQTMESDDAEKVHQSITKIFMEHGAHATVRSVAELHSLLSSTGHL
jgi:phosphonoacetaldehyde hydrolase